MINNSSKMIFSKGLLLLAFVITACLLSGNALAITYTDDLSSLAGWLNCPQYISNGSYYGMYWQHLDNNNDYGYVYRSLGETALAGVTYEIQASLTARLYSDAGLSNGQTYTVTSQAAIAAVPLGVDLTVDDINPYILDGLSLVNYFQKGDANTAGSTEGDGYWDPETIVSETIIATQADAGKELYLVLIGTVSPQPSAGGIQNGIGYVEVNSMTVAFLPGDINKDLYVDFNDLVDMANAWLSCNDYDKPACN